MSIKIDEIKSRSYSFFIETESGRAEFALTKRSTYWELSAIDEDRALSAAELMEICNTFFNNCEYSEINMISFACGKDQLYIDKSYDIVKQILNNVKIRILNMKC